MLELAEVLVVARYGARYGLSLPKEYLSISVTIERESVKFM